MVGNFRGVLIFVIFMVDLAITKFKTMKINFEGLFGLSRLSHTLVRIVVKNDNINNAMHAIKLMLPSSWLCSFPACPQFARGSQPHSYLHHFDLGAARRS